MRLTNVRVDALREKLPSWELLRRLAARRRDDTIFAPTVLRYSES
jgi:hypothetical protein